MDGSGYAKGRADAAAITSFASELLNATFHQPFDSGTPPSLSIEAWDELAKLAPPEWLWGGAILMDAITLIFGAPASQKTFFALALAASISRGVSLGGRDVKKGNVLYLAAEGKRDLFKRLSALARLHGVERLDNIDFICSCPQIGEEGTYQALMEIMRAKRYDAIFIDTAFKHFAGFDMANHGGNHVIYTLERLRIEFGCAVVVIHHPTKGGKNEFGGAMVLGGVDAEISLVRDEKRNVLTLTCVKQKSEKEFEPIRLKVKLIDVDCYGKRDSEPVVCELTEGDKAAGELAATQAAVGALAAIEALGGRAQPRDILVKAGISQATFHRAAPLLIQLGWAVQTGERQPYEITAAGREALVKLSGSSHES